MDYLEAFNAAVNGPWTTIGDDLQYRFEPGPVNRLFFQHTASMRDWCNNFRFPAAPYKNSPKKWYVHRGFRDVWKSGADTIVPMILDCDRLEIFGVSHGGPLANLAHEAYVFTKGYHPKTTTFGSSRFVWFLNAEAVADRFIGVRNIQVNGDLITHLPPKLFGYVDTGSVMRLGPERIVPRAKYHRFESYREELGIIVCPEKVTV